MFWGGISVNDKIKRLGDAELEIMLVIWDTSEPVTSNYILEHLQGRRNWALSTLMTTLARLADKGFVYCDRSTRTNYYSALISAQDYKAKESRSFLERLYGNSLQNLVTSLYDSNTISDDDLSNLRKLIEEIEGRNNRA
jgi:BlaI family penicillinase repressor